MDDVAAGELTAPHAASLDERDVLVRGPGSRAWLILLTCPEQDAPDCPPGHSGGAEGTGSWKFPCHGDRGASSITA